MTSPPSGSSPSSTSASTIANRPATRSPGTGSGGRIAPTQASPPAPERDREGGHRRDSRDHPGVELQTVPQGAPGGGLPPPSDVEPAYPPGRGGLGEVPAHIWH